MLYLFEEIERLADSFPQSCRSRLSPERARKAFSYRFPRDRKLSVAAYLLLCLALRETYGIDGPAVFSYGENGKPGLRDHPEIQFNLSHCACAAACAVSSGDIGVDVEAVVPVSDALAARVLTAKEYDAFKRAEHPSLRFCEYWVTKESYLKKTGAGIGTDLTALSSERLCEATVFKRGPAYCGCVSGAFGSVRRVDAHELSQYCEANDEPLLFRTIQSI